MRGSGRGARVLGTLALCGALGACASPAADVAPAVVKPVSVMPAGASPRAATLRPAALRSQPATPSPDDPSEARRRVVRAAEQAIGAPYRYGGVSLRGFDCSGLVQYAYGHAGIRALPRDSRSLYAHSEKIALGEVEPGDLLFFTFGGSRVSHVAIYVGEDSFVHAPKSGGMVERVRFDHPYWRRHLRLAGRLLDP